ncbi:Hypothetical protein BRZCDTV_420 [Brazilian cedratvirus IHUMI]|uniref:Uncharacterized protein n=1 Tax=Brazilian cedratvirus IHUMI TaxID=2126980 RepID=A0A2R8FF13_9VIRU|nr:Hypothetical protein BRZCDTV_420 [Brazilian cedratvirus IHUMI]
MDVKSILNMSLLEPNLFDESIWRMLCPDWDYYSFLSFSARRKFAEIAVRKGLLRAKSVKKQIWFALLNQRKDLLEDLCRERAFSVKMVCDSLSQEENIYFNRSMINFAYQTLGYVVTDREKVIANFATSTQKTYLEDIDYVRMHSLTGDESMYRKWVERGGIVTDDAKAYFVDSFLKENNKEMWFYTYSITQERDILEKIFERITPENLSLQGRKDILANLYRANHLDLAKRFETKFALNLDLDLILSCLSDYYFNTGDERGVYESLLSVCEGKPTISTLNWKMAMLPSIAWKIAMLSSIACGKKFI